MHHLKTGKDFVSARPYDPDGEKVTEVAGLFDDVETLQSAIRELEGTAFPRQDISVMGRRGEMKQKFGEKTVDPMVVIDDGETPRQPPVRPEERTIAKAAMVGIPAYAGAMAAVLASGEVAFPAIIGVAVIGALGGRVLGAALNHIIGDKFKHNTEEQIEKGGLLLWVRTPDLERQDIAKEIMTRHSGREVHVQSTL